MTSKPSKPPFRLAKGLTDSKPREWSSREKYMLYARGFSDGAGVRAMRPDHQGHPSYDKGYEDGRTARSKAVSKFCKEIGYKLNFFRTQDPSDDGS